MKKLYAFVAAVMTTSMAFAQWGTTAADNIKVVDAYSNTQEIGMTPDGSTWVYYQTPVDEDFSGVGINLQLIDSLGNKKFGEEGMLISNKPTRSWTTCNKYLFVDAEGNAIVAVHDIRNAVETKYLSYTIYKVSPEGEMLWGEDGVELEPGEAFPLSSHMTTTQIADGSYIFAWASVDPTTQTTGVKLQRLSADGEPLWDIEEVRLFDTTATTEYTWPTVVDAGNNQVIVVYFKGSNLDMYARKLDFDGSSVWSEDTRIYRSGWPGVAVWSLIDVKPSGDGGVLVAWTDDRYSTGTATYMSYVKSNGEIGFSAGVDGQKLGYSGLSGTQVECAYDPHTDCFLAVWREAYSASYFCTVAQLLSKDGELLWGEEGYMVQPLSPHQYGYYSLQTAPDGEMAIFYMYDNRQEVEDDDNDEVVTTEANTDLMLTLLNTENLDERRDFVFTDVANACSRSGLMTAGRSDKDFWTALWLEGVSPQTVHMHRVNNDLTLGAEADAAVEGVKADNQSFVALTTQVDGQALFAANMEVPTQATLSIYNVNGALVATPFDGVLAAGNQYIEWTADVPAGVYVAVLTTAQGVYTVKLVVR